MNVELYLKIRAAQEDVEVVPSSYCVGTDNQLYFLRTLDRRHHRVMGFSQYTLEKLKGSKLQAHVELAFNLQLQALRNQQEEPVR